LVEYLIVVNYKNELVKRRMYIWLRLLNGQKKNVFGLYIGDALCIITY